MSLDILMAQLTSSPLRPEDTALFNADDQNLENSKTYQFNGAKMTAEAEGVIPIVYGTHLCPPNIINVFIEGGINDTLNILMAVCEGEIESISNIKINSMGVDEYYSFINQDPFGENAEITIKKGTIDQLPIDGFQDIHSYNAIAVTLYQDTPNTYTTVITNCECIIVEFIINSLYQIGTNGEKIAWYISYKIELKLSTDVTWTNLGIHEINELSETNFKSYFKTEYLTPGRYDIRITKLSSDTDENHFGELIFNSVDEIVTENFSYPSTALIGMRLLASEKLSDSIPNITCTVKGKKVYSPLVKTTLGDTVKWNTYYYDSTADRFKLFSNDSVLDWDGVTYESAWSGNPVWCLRDLLLNTRYGLGEFIASDDLDEASFLASALYCEENIDNLDGKKEKRFQLDIVLDTSRPAIESIYSVCGTFRGLLYICGGKVRLIVDKAEDNITSFNMSSIIKDSFQMNYVSKKSIPNVLSLQYTNKDKNYARDSVEIGDNDSIEAGDSIKNKSVQYIGCTRLSQVMREGTILLKKLKNCITPISFKIGMGAFNCQVGDVFRFQHDLPAWGSGGRLKTGCTATHLILDKAVTLDLSSTYEIEIKHNDTDTIEKVIVSSSNGQFTEIDLVTALSFTPSKYDEWTLGLQNYVGKMFRVTSLTREVDGTVSVNALDYYQDVYDSTGIITPKENFKYLTMEIPNVTNLVAVEQATRLPDGSIDDIINISFLKPVVSSRWVKIPSSFDIQLSDNGGKSWTYIGTSEFNTYTIKKAFVKGLRYTIAVCSVMADGERKVPANSPQVSLDIKGWMNPPSDVVILNYSFEDEIKFTWDKIGDSDVAGYEIRTDNFNWGTNDQNFIYRGQANTYTVVAPLARAGINYYIKAFNTSGLYSSNDASASPVNPAPVAPSVTFTNVFQKVFLMWSDVTDRDLQHYEIWQNDKDVWLGVPNDKEELIGKVTGTSSMQLVPYIATYYRVRGFDKFGGGDWSNVIKADKLFLDSSVIGPGVIKEVNIGDNQITAPKILAGEIQTAHLSALAVTAEKINVECLSAISANLGCMTAGIIIGACIKTSNQAYHTELNNSGLFSYNTAGVNTVKLKDGELCLIDPLCSGFYSYLDSGALKFHHPYGTIPYLKRMQSGVACAGSTVTLCQWYEQPQVVVGTKKLQSYNSCRPESSQELCVFADNIRLYNCGGSNFGWKFDVHARLSLAGGTRPECIYLENFGVTKVTGVCTCQILVKEMFLLFCHNTAPANYYYGQMGYSVKYRQQGCGVWCCCNYNYTQHGSTTVDLRTTNIACQTISLTPGTYEVQLQQNTLTWFNSGISSGTTVTLWCCYQYTVDCSYNYTVNCCCQYQVACSCQYKTYYTSSISPPARGWDETATTYTKSMTFTHTWGGAPANVYCTIVSYHTRGCASVSGYTWPGMNPTGACVNIDSQIFKACHSYGCNTNTSWDGQKSTGEATNRSCIYLYMFLPQCSSGVCSYTSRACGVVDNITATYYYYQWNTCNWTVNCWCYWQETLKCCVLQCQWCCYQYNVYCGSPEYCVYTKFYAMRETSANECVLDPNGEINYMAVSYS